MGAYLSVAKTEKVSSDGENAKLKFGASAMQGWRKGMEDSHVTILDLDKETSLFAVFDGHGGKEVAQFCAKHVPDELLKSEDYKKGDLKQALISTYLRIDDMMMMEEARVELQGYADDAHETEIVGKSKENEILASNENSFSVLEESSEGVDGEVDTDDLGTSKKRKSNLSSRLKEGLEEATAMASKDRVRRKDLHGAVDSEKVGFGESGHYAEADEEDEEDEDYVPHVEDIEEVIYSEEVQPEEDLHDYGGPSAGCTAVSALIRGDEILVANAGDSRCVLCRDGKAVDLSKDHKPDLKEERERILKAGGFVSEGRVNGCLALSRAIGDMEYKRSEGLTPEAQMVTAYPDVKCMKLQPGDEFVVLACDGIWDVMTSQQAINFVREELLLSPTRALSSICEDMFEKCIAPDRHGNGLGMDNMSAIIVLLKNIQNFKT